MEDEIKTRKKLIKALTDLKAVEMMARDNYVRDLKTFENRAIEISIEKIKKDEDRHIALLDDLLKMLK